METTSTSGTTLSAIKRNNVRISGSGERAIVFSHGYGCDQNVWRWVAPAFESDFRVVMFDHVGAGCSDSSQYDAAKYATLDGYVADLIDLLDELGLREVVFVGHSVSSMIGICAAIRRPDLIDRLALLGPSPCYINDGDYVGGFTRADIDELLTILDNNYVSWSATMAPVIMKNPERPELADELMTSFCRVDPAVASQFARVTFLSDNRADLPKLTRPSLILQCTDDAIAPLEVGDYMHARMPGSRLVVMEATGHCPHMSAPDETIEAIRSFL